MNCHPTCDRTPSHFLESKFDPKPGTTRTPRSVIRVMCSREKTHIFEPLADLIIEQEIFIHQMCVHQHSKVFESERKHLDLALLKLPRIVGKEIQVTRSKSKILLGSKLKIQAMKLKIVFSKTPKLASTSVKQRNLLPVHPILLFRDEEMYPLSMQVMPYLGVPKHSKTNRIEWRCSLQIDLSSLFHWRNFCHVSQGEKKNVTFLERKEISAVPQRSKTSNNLGF